MRAPGLRAQASGCCLHCGGALPKYGFGRLEIGEQLLLPLKYRDLKKGVVLVRGAANKFGERYERRFTVVTVDTGALVKRVA